MDLKEEFLEKARKQHGDKFDYSKVEYKNALTKIIIICHKHGEFEQTPNCHINSKTGCLKCKEEKPYLNFLEKAKEVHNDKFDYSKFVYKTGAIKSIIICKIHGEFEDTPINHLNNKIGCPLCIKDKIKSDFFHKAKERYNNKFDYSKFEYVNAKTKSVIICPIHGELLQSPDHHLRSVNACMQCENEQKSIRNTLNAAERGKKVSEKKIKGPEVFLTKAEEKYGSKFEYDLTNYISITEGTIGIKCPEHGWFFIKPRNFLISSCGCVECADKQRAESKTKPYEEFVKEANKKHNNRYNYPEKNKEIFENRKSWIEVECKVHGVFKKQAQKHLVGQGCLKCKLEELIMQGQLPGGYNEELFKNNRDIANKKGFLYYLEFNNGEFYKIGITVNLKNRVQSLKQKFGADKVTIKIKKQYTLENAYYREQAILLKFKNYRFLNNKSTELFSKDISKYDEFKQLISL